MDDIWFSEYHTENVRFSLRVRRQLKNIDSEYQTVSVFDTFEYGRVLTLDGVITLTERDEFIYHEMITHVPMAVNDKIKNILIIGGGDGGAVKELIKYRTVEKIDLVQLDETLVEICKKYMPEVASGLDDERVKIHYEDGLRFLRRKDDIYDLIIVDNNDPYGPGEVLYTREFYGSCYKNLSDQGILVNQNGSPFYEEDAKIMKDAHNKKGKLFPVNLLYQANTPAYASGNWLFGFSSKDLHPLNDFKADKWNKLDIISHYYNTDVHIGAFMLPNYVKEKLK